MANRCGLSERSYFGALAFALALTLSWPGYWNARDTGLVHTWIECHLVLNWLGWTLTLATQSLFDSSSELAFFAPQFFGALIELLLLAYVMSRVAQFWRVHRSPAPDESDSE